MQAFGCVYILYISGGGSMTNQYIISLVVDDHLLFHLHVVEPMVNHTQVITILMGSINPFPNGKFMTLVFPHYAHYLRIISHSG